MNHSTPKSLYSILISLSLLISGCQLNKNTPTVVNTLIGTTFPVISPVSELITPVLCKNGQAATKIAAIQGSQHRSPLDGQKVDCLIGVVTAVRGDGFYLEDPYPDEDESTSEAVFIDANPVGYIAVGDEVRVNSGMVREINPAGPGTNSLTITTVQSEDVEVLSSMNTLPEPIVIGKEGRMIPNQLITGVKDGYVGRSKVFVPSLYGMDFLESLESMRVQINDAVAVSATTRYGEVTIVGDGGGNAGLFSSHGVLVIREEDFNPERLILDDAFILMPQILVGTHFSAPIIGIVNYSFGNYKIEPTERLKYELPQRPADSFNFSLQKNELIIASYNVENLNIQDDPSRLSKLAQDIISALHSPDILVLQEIQDDDGMTDSKTVSANQNLEKIISAIQKDGGPKYAALNIDPARNADGGAVGANIRVVILYRTDRGLTFSQKGAWTAMDAANIVDKNSSPELSLNPGRVLPGNAAFQNSRKPIVAEFKFNGKKLFVIGNHFNSKAEDGPLFGDRQPAPQDSLRQRVAQAKAVNGFVNDILQIDSSAQVIVLGDLNDFPWSESLQALENGLLSNLMDSLPSSEQYSYIYDGNGQALDHILITDSLQPDVVLFKVLHLNTEEAIDNRLSDHDPLLAVIKIP